MNIFKKTIFTVIALLAVTVNGVFAKELKELKVDYAYYSPVSLVLKDKGFLEEDFAKDGIKVKWVLSQGSNKALEYLNSKSIDFGSTAGAASLVSRANGNPIKAIYSYSKPEWTALVTRPDTGIKTVADLKGRRVAATRGTDPFIFLARVLAEAGLTVKDVEVVALQHADGKNALLRKDVDAWAGLDPFMAQAELQNDAILFHRNHDLNTYGILNTREDVIKNHPEVIIRVLKAYEKARHWAISNPVEFKAIYVVQAKVNEEVAGKVLLERTDISEPKITETLKAAISGAGEVLKNNRVISQKTNIEKVIKELFEPKFAEEVV